ncbi:tetratricopeptide repeat protein [Chitinophaga sp. YIM B06452]|uniref:tetratricopeptide repeat protein n=1 Tax=Chitinophaga sp. YIM B06452 TaxID=3082158 RepID=UPI0031FEA949
MNELDHELIERYLSGDMDPATRAAFESRLEKEPELLHTLQTWRDVEETLRHSLAPDAQREELKKTLQQLRPVITKQPAKVVRFNKSLIAIASLAAAVALILYLGPWDEDVYQQYGVREMISPAERGTSADTLLAEAAYQFNHHHYEQAIATLSKVLQQQPDNAYALYYRGLSYLENKQLSQARADLGSIYNGESVFKYEGAFYVALSYLKEDNKDKCREWLGKIPEDAENYAKARELMEKL